MAEPTSVEEIKLPDTPQTKKSKKISSKYDFVKVRVWLEDHYYVLSRFLVSRLLNSTRVSYEDSVKISLELKKQLVDHNKLDVPQSELENYLFQIMTAYGYGVESVSRFRMMTRFHHKRVPLVILIGGAGCTGKSTLATQLADALNLPNVLQVDMVYDLMCCVDSSIRPSAPVWYRKHENSETFIDQFKQECKIIRKGLEADIQKAFEEGKSIIVEGSFLDPQLFTQIIRDSNLNQNSGVSSGSTPKLSSSTSTSTSHQISLKLSVTESNTMVSNQHENNNEEICRPISASVFPSPILPPALSQQRLLMGGSHLPVPSSPELINLTSKKGSGSTSGGISKTSLLLSEKSGSKHSGGGAEKCRGGVGDIGVKSAGGGSPASASAPVVVIGEKEKSKIPKRGVIVPFILTMAREDRTLLVDQWVSSRSGDLPLFEALGTTHQDRMSHLLQNFDLVQQYLINSAAQVGGGSSLGTPHAAGGSASDSTTKSSEGLFQQVPVDLHSFKQTLGALHVAVLERIEQAYRQNAF